MITDLINQKILNKPSIKLNIMVICFFASNPRFYFKQVGSPKSEVRCTGHFSFLTRII
jgi:hypothetical protein